MNGTSLKQAYRYVASIRAPLIFGLHTTAAALLALALCSTAGIHHPWWAAMTVWLVAQPTRGLFIERCVARLAGTAVGAMAGGLFLYFFLDSPGILLCLLATWLVLCSAIGNLFRHFRNYAWVLAGYTAAIVVLFGLMDPVLDPELATGRVICTMIGIMCSSIVSWLLTPKAEPSALLEERLETLVADSIHWCMASPHRLKHAPYPDISQLLGALKELDGSLDTAAAGSRSGRKRVQHALEVVDALLVTLAVVYKLTRSRDETSWTIPFDNQRSELENLGDLIDFAQQKSKESPEYQQLPTVLIALRERLSGSGGPVSWSEKILNHDWRAAATSAIRPLSALTVAALLWRLMGWSDGPIMAMTSVLFASLFSSHADARTAVKDVFIGSLLGACAGLSARIWLFPYVESTWHLLLFVAPFLLTGACFMARAKTGKMAIDFNMTFLLTSQPGVFVHNSIESLLLQTLAILLGVLIAAGSLLLWSPAYPASRRLALARRIARQTMQAHQSSRIALAHARTRPLLRSLVMLEGKAPDLVKAALVCVATTAPYHSGDSSEPPQAREKASSEAMLSAQSLADLASH